MRRGNGAIINVFSVGTKLPYPRRADYISAKMSLVGLTRVLAHEPGPFGITANCVSPGLVDNERGAEAQARLAAALGVSVDDAREIILSRSPLGRTVPLAHISSMVRYLASEHRRSMTGQDIGVAAGVAF